MNTRAHPAASRASSCSAGSCSAVDTQAYPSSAPDPGFGFRGAALLDATFFAGDAAERGFAGLSFTVDAAGTGLTVPKTRR